MAEIVTYWPLVALAINLLIAWGVWSMRATIKVELAALEVRVKLAEQAIQNMPQPREISDLTSQVASLVQQIAGVRDLVVRNEETTKGIHRYLMEKKA